jgi:cytoskeletal protein RodZ
MVQENSQFDISAIQLRESKTQPKVSFSREIGDAQIIHTIFGRAKVRIIRKNDKLNRVLLLVAAVVVTAIAAVVWQGWFASQQIEPQQNADPIPSVSAEANANTLASSPENMTAPAGSPLVKSEPITPPPTETGKPAIIQNNAPQQAIGLKDTRPKTAKPVTIKPKPVTVEPLPTDKPRPLAPSRRTVTPAVATPAAVQPAASGPAAVAPPADPSDKQDTAIKSSVDDKQLSEPINVQSK